SMPCPHTYPLSLHDALPIYETRPRKIWNSVDFFIAKREEQHARHKKHNNTEYNLEPDLKEAPGGLRDIQMISWVAKRHYGCDSRSEEHTSELQSRENLVCRL